MVEDERGECSLTAIEERGVSIKVVCSLDCKSTFFGRTVVISPFNRKGSIKWLRSMAPMTSVLSGFITTFTFSRKAPTHTHTGMHTRTRAHTRKPLYLDGFSNVIDLIDSKGLLFHDQRFPLVCVQHILHTVLRRRENHNRQDLDG